jgi:enoyl-CoA hydratase/carnithine racemase
VAGDDGRRRSVRRPAAPSNAVAIVDLAPQFYTEAGGWLASGALRSQEAVIEGFENTLEAFFALMRGESVGKMVVKSEVHPLPPAPSQPHHHVNEEEQSMSKASPVTVDRPNPKIARVTFTNPPVNTMIPEGITALYDSVTAFEQDDDVQVVIFDSGIPDFYVNHYDGTRAGDLPAPAHEGAPPLWTDLVLRITKAPFISIARIRGRARGAGAELAMACDLRYASIEKAFFGQPETGIAIVPGGGGAERLPRAIGRDRALEAILTAADYPADIAERWGWVTRALPDAELDGFVEATATRLASFDKHALAQAKTMVNRATLPPDEGLSSAFYEFADTLTRPAFADRSTRLGALVAEHGLEVEYEPGAYLARANQTD